MKPKGILTDEAGRKWGCVYGLGGDLQRLLPISEPKRHTLGPLLLEEVDGPPKKGSLILLPQGTLITTDKDYAKDSLSTAVRVVAVEGFAAEADVDALKDRCSEWSRVSLSDRTALGEATAQRDEARRRLRTVAEAAAAGEMVAMEWGSSTLRYLDETEASDAH